MNSKSKDTFTGGEIIESDDVWIINSIDWNGTGFRYGIFFEKGFGCIDTESVAWICFRCNDCGGSLVPDYAVD